MRLAHYITIAIAVALIIILYFGGNTIPPVSKEKENLQITKRQGEQGSNDMKPISLDTLLSTSKRNLRGAAKEEIITIENELATMHDSMRMVASFLRLSKVWEANNEKKLATYFIGVAAKLENSNKKLTFAAQIFLDLMQQENNAAIQSWEAKEAVLFAEQALLIDSSLEDTKLALATGYIEGTGEPMKGVKILLGIVGQKPNDIPANLLLGKMSVQSGQIDKAIGRLETVLKQDSVNKEALYFLAQAYKGKGEKQKAIELLEKCKRIVNDNDFSNKANEEINSLK